MTENEIGSIVVDVAVRLHRNLGPGLLENVYEVILARQLAERGLSVQRQVSIPIEFEGEYFEEAFRKFSRKGAKFKSTRSCYSKASCFT